MNTLTIAKKKYVVVLQKDYEDLLTKAARKATPAKKTFTSTGKETCL
jgi:hypothetical protein